jgi:hypothetical protein
MADTTQITATSQVSDDSSLANQALKVIAYPIAGLSGLWAASISVTNSAYETARKLHAFDDILQKVTPKSEADIQDCIHGVIDSKENFDRAIKSKLEYHSAVNARMKKLGLDSFERKWDYVAKASKEDAALKGMTASGVAIGALLTIANSKLVSKIFSGHHEREQER